MRTAACGGGRQNLETTEVTVMSEHTVPSSTEQAASQEWATALAELAWTLKNTMTSWDATAATMFDSQRELHDALVHLAVRLERAERQLTALRRVMVARGEFPGLRFPDLS
jgi:hypothetical protein